MRRPGLQRPLPDTRTRPGSRDPPGQALRPGNREGTVALTAAYHGPKPSAITHRFGHLEGRNRKGQPEFWNCRLKYQIRAPERNLILSKREEEFQKEKLSNIRGNKGAALTQSWKNQALSAGGWMLTLSPLEIPEQQLRAESVAQVTQKWSLPRQHS
ncbi:hypothetical protein MUG91_G217n5 [Manis pentadactyla]|nr:hypothetical protein MUG91_G217n5 [Manis pentadactyla]